MNRLAMYLLSIWAGWSVAMTAHAQSAVSICSFDASGTNGAYPEASLTLGPDGNFYGTTESGGTSTNGTIFKVTTNGTLTTLVNFTAANGANPHGGLTWGPDGNFYGSTAGGGADAAGTLFSMTTGGTLSTLTNFSGANGASPFAGLTLGPDGNFYGTTESGGSAGYGTVFELATNRTLTTLANFDGTNNGVTPYAGLTLGPDGNLYGTTSDSYLLAYTVFPGSVSYT